MQLQSVRPSNVSFGTVYVTTSTKNNGDYVEKNVIDPFRPVAKDISQSDYADEFKDLADTTDLYVLAAGEGSRFRTLAHTQGPKVNKISFGLPLLDKSGQPTGGEFHMLDIPMAMAAPLIDENGLVRMNAKVARGSFAEVISNAKALREQGLPQKDVIVMCGDNLFDTNKDKPFELLSFCKEIIDNPDKQMGLIGVERTPEEVANRFGVLKVSSTDKDDIYSLEGFTEKPKTAEKAAEFATDNGNCIANTGMFVIKSEAMEYLLNNILMYEGLQERFNDRNKYISGFIEKNESEPYDFAAACERVQKHYGKDKCDVKTIETWEDAGEPAALYRTIGEWQKGHFLACLPPDLQQQIRSSATIIYDGKTLLSTPEAVEQFGTAENASKQFENIDGVMVAKKPLDIEA